MTSEEQAKSLEHSLHQLESMKKKSWMTADDRRAILEILRETKSDFPDR